MEGVNFARILLGYLAILLLAITSLVALGLLIARLTSAARILFAAGLLSATLVAAFATLTFLEGGRPEPQESLLLVLTALTLLLAGAGQFVASLRDPRTYAAALACAAGSLLLLASPMLGGDAGAAIPGIRYLFAAGLVPLVSTSLLLSGAGLIIAVVLPSRSRRSVPLNPESGRRGR